MPEQPSPPGEPDPWQIVVELTGSSDAARREHPELASRIEGSVAAFGGSGESVADLLDEVDRRAVVDVDAPVASSRPVVPQMKLAVRKAGAFVSRHMAQQVTVLVSGLSAAVRQLDERVGRLERDSDGGTVLTLAPDVTAVFEQRLSTVAAAAPGPRRDIRSPTQASTLPERDAGLIVIARAMDVLATGERLELVRRAVGGLAPGGRLAVVGVSPTAWERTAGPVVMDLAPARPLHAETWAHLLSEAGGTDVDVHEESDAYLVTARW